MSPETSSRRVEILWTASVGQGGRFVRPAWRRRTVLPRREAYLVARSISEDPAARRIGVVDDATTGGKRGRESNLRMLASDRDIDVHRMPERLGWASGHFG